LQIYPSQGRKKRLVSLGIISEMTKVAVKRATGKPSRKKNGQTVKTKKPESASLTV
jgi:hypothetical protein